MKRYLGMVALAALALAACGGGRGASSIPPAPDSSQKQTNNQVRVAMSSDADADQDVPAEAKGQVRKEMRELMKRIPKANRKRFMFFTSDDGRYAGSKETLALMQNAHHDPSSKYSNYYLGTDGRSFIVPTDTGKPNSTGRTNNSQQRSPMLAAGATPVPSTANGPFRRQFSTPGYSYSEGDLYLPCDDTATFQTNGTRDIEGGYVYTGGWGIGAGGQAVDAGFQRSSLQHIGTEDYAPFIKAGNSPTFHYTSDRIICGRSVHYVFQSPSLSTVELDVYANDASFQPQYVAVNNLGGWAPDGGTTSDGMVIKRMTTIGQPEGWSNPNDTFNYNSAWYADGSNWGFDAFGNPAVHWYNSLIGYYSDNTATTYYTNPWDATGGYQNFPNDTSRIVYTNVSPAEEFDAINLHY